MRLWGITVSGDGDAPFLALAPLSTTLRLGITTSAAAIVFATALGVFSEVLINLPRGVGNDFRETGLAHRRAAHHRFALITAQ